jgi:23S rRNA (uracil1939-C5)-methyltransferase
MYKDKEKKSDSPCPHAKKCGGCQLQGVPYEEQLRRKRELVRQCVSTTAVHPVIGMAEPTHYRNKVHAAFGRDRKGNVLSGVYENGSHRIVPHDHCMIEDERADAIIADIRGLLKTFRIKTYDEDSGYGLLRHVMVRTAHTTGEILVVLVLASPILPAKNNFVKALRKLHPEITSIVLNVNERHTSMVLGERNILLYGKGYIEDELCGRRYRISPNSFYQVNAVQTRVLYEKAMEYAGLTGKETVIDAYCGIGTIGMTAASLAGQVIGVELNPSAVKDAIANARRNGCKNITFVNDDAGDYMRRLAGAPEHPAVDVVFMDPPRSGSSEAFMDAAALLAPKRIVYVSCDPHTLGRDLEYLKTRGYAARECQPNAFLYRCTVNSSMPDTATTSKRIGTSWR